jgi:carbonic anhydrase
MHALLLGIADFLRTRRAAYAATFARLARGQRPDTLLIACSDSRVSPVVLAESDPGDVFLVRNVGNLVPVYDPDAVARAPSVGAAIEYALTALPVEDVVVCGHSGCGAVHAIMEGRSPPGAPHLAAWLEHGRRVLADLPPAPLGVDPEDHVSQQSVLRQVENLRTYPVVRERERAGRVRLAAWWFDVGSAEVREHDAGRSAFLPLDADRIARRLASLEAARAGRTAGRSPPG